jgi:HEAT repeat protein
MKGDECEAMERILERLHTQLKHTNVYCQFIAARKLGNIMSPGSVAPLLNTLRSESKEVRREVIDSLGKIGDERAVPQLIMKLQDEDILVRISAVRALGRIGGRNAIDPLFVLLKDSSSEIRCHAVEALGAIARPWSDLPFGYSSEGKRITEGLPEETQRHRRTFIEKKVDDPVIVEALIFASKDKDHRVREGAICQLINMKGRGIEDVLVEALSDPNEVICQWALRGLDDTLSPKCTDALVAVLNRKESHLRKSAIEMLARKKPRKAILKIIDQLNDGNKDIKRAALRAIDGFKFTDVVAKLENSDETNLLEFKKALEKCAEDSDDFVRGETAKFIAKNIHHLNSSFISILMNLAKDKEQLVRRCVCIGICENANNITLGDLLNTLHEFYMDDDYRVRCQLGESIIENISKIPGRYVEIVGKLSEEDDWRILRPLVWTILDNADKLSEDTIKLVTKMIRREDYNIRDCASKIAENAEHLPQEVINLLPLLAEDKHYLVRRGVAEGITKYSEKLPKDFLDLLDNLSEDASEDVRGMVAYGILKNVESLPERIRNILLRFENDESIRPYVNHIVRREFKTLMSYYCEAFLKKMSDSDCSIHFMGY